MKHQETVMSFSSTIFVVENQNVSLCKGVLDEVCELFTSECIHLDIDESTKKQLESL